MTTTKRSKQEQQQFPWCCTAEFDRGINIHDCTGKQEKHYYYGSPRITRIAGYDDTSNEINAPVGLQQYTHSFDLTKSSDWMEWVEGKDPSAYDTLRCDLILQQKLEIENDGNNNDNKRTVEPNSSMFDPQRDPSEKWKIWGFDYHVQRLQQSFLMLRNMNDKSKNSKKLSLEHALRQSTIIFDALLQEADRALQQFNPAVPRDNDEFRNDNRARVWIQLIRFTWLWTMESAPATQSTNSISAEDEEEEEDRFTIRVRGHACSTAQPINIWENHKKPISALIAAVWDERKSQVQLDESLPHRHNNNPQVKLTAWTRQRKQLEQQVHLISKHGGDNNNPTPLAKIGEVLLVRYTDSGDDVELLEGMSSNVFVILKDGSLQTASSQMVLSGYVRHLILQIYYGQQDNCHSATTKPILLSNVDQWKEVFITSSSRLIVPVHTVMIPNPNSGQWVEFWRADNDNPNQATQWKLLEEQLFQLGGYKT